MGFLGKGLLLYLFIAIAVTFAAPQVVFNVDGSTMAERTVLGWFEIDYDYANNGDINFNSTSSDYYSEAIASCANDDTSPNCAFLTASSPAGTGSLLGFLDPVFQVFGWIPMIFKVLFSPIILFTAVDMPGIIILLIAIPLVLLMIVALISFIRGVN